MNQYFKHKMTNCFYAVINGKYYLVYLFISSVSVEVSEDKIFSESYIQEYYSECTESEFEAAKAEAISKL